MHTYSNGINTWNVEQLWEAAAELKAVEVPIHEIVDIDELLDSHCWSAGAMSIREILDHADRVANADLAYPIILFPNGNNSICDGVHRIIKAFRLGHATIKVVRLPTMPPPIK